MVDRSSLLSQHVDRNRSSANAHFFYPSRTRRRDDARVVRTRVPERGLCPNTLCSSRTRPRRARGRAREFLFPLRGPDANAAWPASVRRLRRANRFADPRFVFSGTVSRTPRLRFWAASRAEARGSRQACRPRRSRTKIPLPRRRPARRTPYWDRYWDRTRDPREARRTTGFAFFAFSVSFVDSFVVSRLRATKRSNRFFALRTPRRARLRSSAPHRGSESGPR